MRRTALLALVGALLLAGCGGTFAPATDTPGTSTASPDGPSNGTVTEAGPGGDGTANRTTMADQPRPDPETDQLGWENGYWYNDPLPVNNTADLTTEQREAVLARSMARVERVRNLEFNSTVEVSVRSRENASFGGGGDRDPALRKFDNAKFEAAFLIGEDDDSLSVQQESRNQTVAGYYDPEADAIVLVSDSATPTLDGEGTLSHELTHAIQDQRLNLSVQRRVDTRDGYNGVLGLVEGEANAVQQAYTARCGEEWSCLSPPSGNESESGTVSNYGTYLLKFFPYSDGPGLIASLRDGDDWSRVSAAYDDPPRTAQVVIEPSDYGSFEVEDVELRDRTSRSWERVRPPARPDYGRLGRSGLGAMFARTLYDDSNRTSLVGARELLNLEGGEVNTTDPLNYDLEITRGWTGDRLHVYGNGDELAYVWRITWESAADAERFADAYRTLLSYWGGDRVAEGVWVVEEGPFADAFRVTVDGSQVTVTNAPTRAELDEVRAP